MNKFVWNGKIESEIDTINFETFQKKVCPKDEFETTKEYKERLIKEGCFNKWLGKQIVSMQYNADIEQFRVAIENRWGKVLEFDIAVPRAEGVARGFKENIKNFNIYCEEKEGKFVAVRAEAKYNGEIYSADLNIWILNSNLVVERLTEWSDKFGLGLPKSWEKLQELKEIKADSNPFTNITYIPEEIGYLTNLKRLSLDNNQIKEIPESIGNLSNLQELSLWENQIIEIPESIGNLSNLQVLSLGNHPLLYFEKEKIKKLLPNTNIFF